MRDRSREGAAGYGFMAVFGAHGRIGRVQFAVSVVYQTLLSSLVAALMMIFVGGPMISAAVEDITSVVVFALISFVAELATTSLLFFSVRARLNDIGVSNWWTIPMAVPTLVWLAGATLYEGLAADVIQSIGAVTSLAMLGILFAWRGTDGPNAYGAPPRSPATALQLAKRPPALN